MDEENQKQEEQAEVIKPVENNSQTTQSNSDGEGKGFSVTSLVLGIISLVLWCYWPLSITCAILAIIFGIVGKKREGRGMAIAGIVLGIIALCIWVIILICGAAFVASAPGILYELESLNSTMYY